ncbi:MFS transporter [Desulfobacterales bacterium HSG16]|nr:MFS transporter [Desulfobacterales bacterium HSG16]
MNLLRKPIKPDMDEQFTNNKSLISILCSQYFLYFGMLGIFLPWFNLYCHHIGFSGHEIGIISAVRSVVTVIFPLVWGAVADRFQARRPIYILVNFVSASIWTLYIFTEDFKLMIIITIFYTIFYAPVIAFLEAFAIDVLGQAKKDYGRLRVWGTIAFIIMVAIFGKIIDFFSIKVILFAILAGSFLQAVISLKIPETKVMNTKAFKVETEFLAKPKTIVFLFCAFLMLVSHGAYYGFFSIHLEEIGCGPVFIGLCWAFGTASEIAIMINSRKIFQRFKIEHILVFSLMTASVRWLILSMSSSPSIIFLSQLLHAVTYGTFHVGSILYIDTLAPESAKTTGQAINNALTYGLGMMVGFFFTGYLFESMGMFKVFGICSIVALAGGILFFGFYRFEGATNHQ